MSTTLLVIVLALGVLLLALEIVVLPGGVAGAIGIAMIAFGVWQTYNTFGNVIGTWVLVGAFVICMLLLLLFLRRKTWSKFSLDEESSSKVNTVDNDLKVGMQGVTISRLAPTGKALINGNTYEVHSVNKYIDNDCEIEVINIEGYRVDVREKTDNRFENQNNNKIITNSK
ncbi:MAG: hypothetical protein IJ761_00885 [Bacteroidales bacterium]|nr:hypothetical protein [Bacteroidales bacterium]